MQCDNLAWDNQRLLSRSGRLCIMLSAVVGSAALALAARLEEQIVDG